MVFIFMMSAMPGDVSGEQSGFVTEMIEKALTFVFGAQTNSDVGIKDIIATTNTELRNLDTDSVYRYSTKNEISFLRSYEKNNDKTNKPRTIQEYHRYEQKLYSKFIKFYM